MNIGPLRALAEPDLPQGVAKFLGWSCITWLRIATGYSRYHSATRRLKNHPMQGKIKDAGGRRLGVLAGSMSLCQCRGSSGHSNS